METEQELLRAIRDGDRQALRRLYDRYSGYATAVGLRYIPDAAVLRDVLQDSFVRILTSVSDFEYRGEGSLKSWVARIVANRSLDYLREHERQPLMADLAETLTLADDDPPEAEEPDVSALPPDVLTALIGQLPPGYRQVLNLHVFARLTHRETARRLGIAESTSASQFLRAKALLAKMINDYLDQHEI